MASTEQIYADYKKRLENILYMSDKAFTDFYTYLIERYGVPDTAQTRRDADTNVWKNVRDYWNTYIKGKKQEYQESYQMLTSRSSSSWEVNEQGNLVSKQEAPSTRGNLSNQPISAGWQGMDYSAYGYNTTNARPVDNIGDYYFYGSVGGDNSPFRKDILLPKVNINKFKNFETALKEIYQNIVIYEYEDVIDPNTGQILGVRRKDNPRKVTFDEIRQWFQYNPDILFEDALGTSLQDYVSKTYGYIDDSMYNVIDRTIENYMYTDGEGFNVGAFEFKIEELSPIGAERRRLKEEAAEKREVTKERALAAEEAMQKTLAAPIENYPTDVTKFASEDKLLEAQLETMNPLYNQLREYLGEDLLKNFPKDLRGTMVQPSQVQAKSFIDEYDRIQARLQEMRGGRMTQKEVEEYAKAGNPFGEQPGKRVWQGSKYSMPRDYTTGQNIPEIRGFATADLNERAVELSQKYGIQYSDVFDAATQAYNKRQMSANLTQQDKELAEIGQYAQEWADWNTPPEQPKSTDFDRLVKRARQWKVGI